MKIAKIVIGSNLGDEGKGLMTDYFAHKAKQKNMKCLVVCHNGGSQKGHTVVSPDSVRHVFHHFGSGCFEGADTYLGPEFIVNPIIFNKELEDLKRKNIATKIYVNSWCKLTTPFDMMINQIVEEYRKDNKHGSCGLGILETIERFKNTIYNLDIYDFSKLSLDLQYALLNDIATNYVITRLNELGVKNIPTKWVDILNQKHNIILNYINDFNNMMNYVEFCKNDIIDKYDYVIFEGSQGLLLDQNNKEYMPNLTPSNTGIKNPMNIIRDRNIDIEVCYVSRTYMTRHGAGRLDNECKKEDINSKMIDLTNVPNPFQGALRYGYLDINDLKIRTNKDCKDYKVKKSIAFTHLNEYSIDLYKCWDIFDDYNIYTSDGMTHNDIVLYKKII